MPDRVCYLTHAFKPDREVTPLKAVPVEYTEIYDPLLKKTYIVPNDQLEYKELDVGDLL